MLFTERMELIPLTMEQIDLWIHDLPALEQALQCKFHGDLPENGFLNIIQRQRNAMDQDPDNWRYYTFWLLLRRQDQTVVGEIEVKNPPDPKGQVEIGYGVSEAYRNKGYATEAARELGRWLLAQPGVEAVVASTTRENAASARVLEKCGMERCQWSGDTLWYRWHWRDTKF